VYDGYGTLDRGRVRLVGPTGQLLSRQKLGENGGFRFSTLQEASYGLVFHSPAWGTITLDPFDLNQDVDLIVNYELRASVIAQLLGGPQNLDELRGRLRFWVEGPTDNIARQLRIPCHIDFDRRRLEVNGLGPGVFLLTGVRRGSAVEKVFEIKQNGELIRFSVNIDQSPQHSLFGRALLRSEEGTRPLSKTTLRVEANNQGTATISRVVTDGDGYFDLSTRLLGAGTVLKFFRDRELPYVRIVFDPSGPAERSEDSPAEPPLYEVVFDDVAERRAILVDMEGSPLPFGIVDLDGGSPDKAYTKRVSHDGRFPITNVVEGQYKLTLHSSTGSVRETPTLELDSDSDDVLIRIDMGRYLVLVARTQAGQIVRDYLGRYRTDSGNYHWLGFHVLPARIPTDVSVYDGRMLTDLPDSSDYEIQVLSAERGMGRRTVSRVEVDRNHVVEIALEPFAAAEVSLQRPDGSPLTGAKFAIEDFSARATAHLEHFTFVPTSEVDFILNNREAEVPGTYTLQIVPTEFFELVITDPSSAETFKYTGQHIASNAVIVADDPGRDGR
jgi:hypothetical protein